jgi:ApaG protein
MHTHLNSGDIAVEVISEYIADQSSASEHRFVFAYHVRIENRGNLPAQLLTW